MRKVQRCVAFMPVPPPVFFECGEPGLICEPCEGRHAVMAAYSLRQYPTLRALVETLTPIGEKHKRKRVAFMSGVRQRVFDRDGRACRCCGSHLDLAVDHIVPVALGGTDDLDNLQVLCARCNSAKGARLWSIWDLRSYRGVNGPWQSGPALCPSKIFDETPYLDTHLASAGTEEDWT